MHSPAVLTLPLPRNCPLLCTADYDSLNLPPGTLVPSSEQLWGTGNGKLPPEWEAWDSNFEGVPGAADSTSGPFQDAEWLDAEQHEPVGRAGGQVWHRGQRGELLEGPGKAGDGDDGHEERRGLGQPGQQQDHRREPEQQRDDQWERRHPPMHEGERHPPHADPRLPPRSYHGMHEGEHRDHPDHIDPRHGDDHHAAPRTPRREYERPPPGHTERHESPGHPRDSRWHDDRYDPHYQHDDEERWRHEEQYRGWEGHEGGECSAAGHTAGDSECSADHHQDGRGEVAGDKGGLHGSEPDLPPPPAPAPVPLQESAPVDVTSGAADQQQQQRQKPHTGTWQQQQQPGTPPAAQQQQEQPPPQQQQQQGGHHDHGPEYFEDEGHEPWGLHDEDSLPIPATPYPGRHPVEQRPPAPTAGGIVDPDAHEAHAAGEGS